MSLRRSPTDTSAIPRFCAQHTAPLSFTDCQRHKSKNTCSRLLDDGVDPVVRSDSETLIGMETIVQCIDVDASGSIGSYDGEIGSSMRRRYG